MSTDSKKVKVKNYLFGLYDGSGDQLMDTTNINEDNPDLAMELFQDFSREEGYRIREDWFVVLLEETEELVDEDDL
jgi:hypothetical protein